MSCKSRATATLRSLLLLMLGMGSGQAWAQVGDAPEADPPDRAARLSFIDGDVAMQPVGEQSWAPAILNRPLTTGDRISTEKYARAEIEVGLAAIRLGDNTGFSFLNLDSETVLMRLVGGVMRVHVRSLDARDTIGIETPNLTLLVLQPGTYRVEVNDAGDTTVVKVSDGELQATGAKQKVIVRAGQAATFTGIEQLTASFDALGEPDEFDSWTGERERRDYLASTRSEYVSSEIPGAQELDEYGTWSSDPTYGNVWTPSYVTPGWSPYAYGRWLWVQPWGWTWIDDQPWGYAPSHYGRWAHVRNRWCWVPGPRHHRAVYAPALVGWNGARHGHVSWFPLGPGDAYTPNGRYSRRYLERVNESNTQIARSALKKLIESNSGNARYHNRAVPGSVTTVARETFTSAERVGNRRVRLDDRELARTPASSSSPGIVPELASRLGDSPRAHWRTPTQSNFGRPAMVNGDPSSATSLRPSRREQPAAVTPGAHPSDTNQGAWPTRPRETRVQSSQQPTQMDGLRQEMSRRAVEQRQQQREAEAQQSLQRQQDHQQQRVQQQQQQHQNREQQYRESIRRAQEAVRQAQPRVEQPRVQQPRVEQPRVSQPAQPRVSQPAPTRVERPQTTYKPAESRPAPAPRASTPRSGDYKPSKQ